MRTPPQARPLAARLLLSLALLATAAAPSRAAYVRRYATVANGAMTFTGNSLGLDKSANSNNQGTSGSIGTFITTNTALRDGASYPFGTTNDWRLNSSSALLRMLAGSTVEYAELVWNGSYNYGGENVSANLNEPINFTTPAGTFAVTSDVATRKTLTSPLFYVRSADVTNLVASGGAGTYTVGRVPATQGNSENNNNVAGWSLCVVFSNPTLPPRNMTVFVGAELTNGTLSPTSAVSGFCTPRTGPVNARLLVSAMEGDASITGDTMRFGPTVATLQSISGPRNLANNFFAGQVTDDSGNLDTAGTFGSRNHTAGSPQAGSRQGWDVTNIDVSARMLNGQNSAVARGTSTGDQYTISMLGLQIDVGTPKFPVDTMAVDKPSAVVGDILTYTTQLDNTAGTADAINVVFKNSPPPGTSFVAGSVRVDGVARPTASVLSGVSVGTVAIGQVRTVVFQLRINSIPLPPAPSEWRNTGTWNFQFESCPALPLNNGTVTTGPPTLTITPALTVSKRANTPAALVAGQVVTYTIDAKNTSSADVTAGTLQDSIPTGTTYLPGTTLLNGVAVADVGGQMPFVTARAINSPGRPAGRINIGETATVTFQVQVQPAPPLSIPNRAVIDSDGAGPAPAVEAWTQNPLETADLSVAKTDGVSEVTAGGPVQYTVTVTNHGPDRTSTFTLVDTLPSAVRDPVYSVSTGTYNPDTGVWSGPSLAAGQTVTLTINGTVDPGATGTLTNNAQVASQPSPVGDTNPANNSASDTSAIIQRADLSVLKTDGQTTVMPGDTPTYLLEVSNAGPSTVRRVTLQDVLPAELTDPSFSPPEGFYNDETGLWTGIELEPGETLVMSLRATVAAGAVGPVVNRVTVALPAGVVDPDLTDNEATDSDTVGPPGYKITGRVYEDVDHGGTLNGAETGTGVAGLYVKLLDGTATALQAAAVDPATGLYELTAVTAGAYSLVLDDNNTLTDLTAARPAGWLGTEAPDQSIAGVTVVDTDLAGYDLGLYHGATLAGRVFDDSGGGGGTAYDGVVNGAEAGLAGVTVKLQTSAGVDLASALTDASGNFFHWIPHAQNGLVVWLAETNPAGYASIAGNPGTTAGTYDRPTDRVAFVAASGTAYTGVLLADAPTRNLSGRVYGDLDHNAAYDGAETGLGLAGWHVKLLDSLGVGLAAAPVDAATGAYQFSGLAPSLYTVILDDNATLTDLTASRPAGYLGTQAPEQVIAGIALGGADLPNQNFGLYRGSRLRGRVFEDNGAGGGVAHNGLQDGAELGLAGVTLRATSPTGTIFDTTATDATGAYGLILPETANGTVVRISEANPAGYVSISGVPGNTGGSYDRAADTTVYTHASGAEYGGVDFGDVPATTFATDSQRTVVPGTIHYYPHQFVAGTAGSVAFSSQSTADPAGPEWQVQILSDLDGDGVRDPEDVLLTAPLTVTAGESISLLVQETVPLTVPFGAVNTTLVTAKFAYRAAAPPLEQSLQRSDRTTVAAQSGLALAKTVNNPTARPGQVVTYTIAYTNTSGAPLTVLVIDDQVPTFTSLVSIAHGPLPADLTACTITSPAAGGTGQLRWQFTGTLQAGSGGTVSYEVRLDP
ncbi:MAG: DUF11 domain-containing protein [Armatimonadetes bacterium]|nr:DUF11 domain-containing protein [Armatimonadota bacterium]